MKDTLFYIWALVVQVPSIFPCILQSIFCFTLDNIMIIPIFWSLFVISINRYTRASPRITQLAKRKHDPLWYVALIRSEKISNFLIIWTILRENQLILYFSAPPPLFFTSSIKIYQKTARTFEICICVWWFIRRIGLFLPARRWKRK